MRGTFTPDGAPVLTVEVLGPGGLGAEIDAVVGTGFNGHLTLRPSMVRALSLDWTGEGESELADGSVVEDAVPDGDVVITELP